MMRNADGSLSFGSESEMMEAIAHAILRAESAQHVSRTVAALESIAKSLETIAATTKHSANTPDPTTRLSGLCVNCNKIRPTLNSAGWCFDCFSGKGPTRL